jgi:hypothetical protein
MAVIHAARARGQEPADRRAPTALSFTSRATRRELVMIQTIVIGLAARFKWVLIAHLKKIRCILVRKSQRIANVATVSSPIIASIWRHHPNGG